MVALDDVFTVSGDSSAFAFKAILFCSTISAKPSAVILDLVPKRRSAAVPFSSSAHSLTCIHTTESAIMGISRDSRHKRSATGAKRAYYSA